MKRSHVGVVPSAPRWSRFLRSLFALTAIAGAASVFAQTYSITTLAGVPASSGNVNTSSGTPRFAGPAGVAVDGAGNVYVADSGNNSVRKITSGGVVTTLATGFNGPGGVAVDGSGNVYVADTFNHSIKKIDTGGTVTVVAGPSTATSGPSVASATLTAARFNGPNGVATNSGGTILYVADTGNQVVRRIDIGGNAVTTIAGTQGSAGTGAAQFNAPWAAALNAAGTILYVADYNNHAIRKIDNLGTANTLSTFAGTLGTSGSTDTPALFNRPAGVAVDGAGNVYVADFTNNIIRRITSGGTVATLAGQAGSSGTLDGVGNAARFSGPYGIASDSSGTVYIGDSNNHTIRKGVLAVAPGVSGQPSAATFTIGTTTSVTFTVTATGSPILAYQWQRAPASSPTSFTNLSNGSAAGLTVSGATTATLSITAATLANSGDLFRAVVSNGVTPNATSNSVALAVNQKPTITSANSTSFAAGSSNSFTVTASGSPAPTYTVSGNFPSTWANQSTFESSGVISGTPPSTAGSPFVFTITAVNSAGTSDPQTFTLTVLGTSAPVINTQPANQTVPAGQTGATFTVAAIGNPAITSYQWQRQAGGSGSFVNITNGAPAGVTYAVNATTGTLSISGITPAMNNDKFQVIIGNSIGSTTSSAATLTVAGTLPVVSAPGAATVDAGQNATFTASATAGNPTPTLKWQRQAAGTSGFVDLTEGAPYTGVTTGTLTVSAVTAAMNGDQFRLVASNVYGAVESAPATLTVSAVIPTITANPQSTTRDVGQAATFAANASGNPSPTLRWQRRNNSTDWTDLPESAPYSGTTTGTLTVSPVSAQMNGDQFRLVATNTHGSATSSPAFLTINNTAPSVVSSPQSTTVNVGANASFSATISASPSPTLRWQRQPNGSFGFQNLTDDGVYSGTGSSTLTITNVTASMHGDQFQLVADNGLGTVTTFAATLSVTTAAPTITTQPIAATVNLGANATFTAAASGTPAPTYRWQRQASGTSGFVDLNDDGVYSGTTTTTLTVLAVTAVMSGDQFQMVARNDVGSVTSNPVALTINLGTTITTFVGVAGSSGTSDGTGTAARFNGLTGIAVGPDGNIYVADTSNHVIRRISSAGVVTTLAGQALVSGSIDGVGTAARFNSPQGIAVDGVGNVYVADTFNHTIRLITSTGSVSTVAGLANNSGLLDGNGTEARFAYPTALTLSGGSIYVTDSSNHAIRRISGATVVTFAGTIGSAGFLNSTVPTQAKFNSPNGIVADSSGNLYVSDSFNHVIRKITSGGVVTTHAGTAGLAGVADGNSTLAAFNRPYGLALDASGNIYVADTFSSTIRKISPTVDVTTIAGLAGVTGSSDGAGTAARFNQPFGIALDAAGNIYISDTRNHTIRRSGTTLPPQIQNQPTSAIGAVGGTATFTVVASGSPPPSYQWQRMVGNSGLFLTIFNDGTFSGVTTSTLTIGNIVQEMHGDQYRVIVNNGVLPAAVSEAATLTVGAAPVITSANSATFQAGQAGTFTVTATSQFPVTFASTNLPPWASLDASSGVISGTPPDTSGSPFSVNITATNGLSTSQTLTINVTPATRPPTIDSHPASVAVDQGGTATFNVAVSGTAPFTYQWRRNATPISGATASSFSLSNVQPSAAGAYSVVVTNSVGNQISNSATLTVNTAPAITFQPHTQTAVLGGSISFSIGATGSNLGYQWRRNGVPLVGQNGPTLTLNNISNTDAGSYDVLVSNSLGAVPSSLVQLSIASGPTAPVITAQPASRTALVGTSATLSVGAAGVPTPTYQWRKDGNNIAGANSPTYVIGNVQAGDAGSYSVFISNGSGTVISSDAVLRVIARSYAGVYFGTFSSSQGNFALFVREDNTGVFLGYLPGATAPVMSLNIIVNDNGSFTFTQAPINTTSIANVNEPARAAALEGVTVVATIGNDGSVTGSMIGGANASLTASRSPDSGVSQNVAGFYQAGAGVNSATLYTIASPGGQAMVVARNGNTFDGGQGTVTSAGNVTVNTGRSTIAEVVNAAAGTITGTAVGVIGGSFSGGSDVALSTQRLVNISSRARVASGDSVAIAGFVISGEVSKPVLIRAVGPTIGAAPFNVPGSLATPRLELFRQGNNTALMTNAGIAGNRAAIDAAGQQAGAFALGSSGADAAILTTLPPGNYTAVVSSTNNTAGVALIEVYDLGGTAVGQKLLNISTRAAAATGENTLTAGFVIPSGPAKRVLVRGVGPGLAALNVSGVLPQPTLTLLRGNGASATTVAQNSNWSTSADAAAITTASTQVGAFTMAPQDAAMVVTLEPGNYTAQIVGAGGASGVALIEVYELP